MIRRALVGACVVLGMAAGTALALGPISLDEYRAVVHNALTLVDQAGSETNPSTRAPLLSQAADRLEAVTEVETTSGTTFRINNVGLVGDLRAASAGKANVTTGDLHDRLAALEVLLSNPPTEPSAADRAKLQEIFNRPPFVPEPEGPLAQLQRQFLEWLNRLLSNTAQGVFDLRDVIVVVGVGVVAVGTAALVYAFRRNLVAMVHVKEKEVGQAPLTAARALSEARQFANAGNYREAVRELYLATLLMLDERGLLRYDRSLTNREYLDAVAGEPAVHAALEPIVNTFDRTWYGFQAMGQEEFESYRRQVQGMRDL